MINNPRKRGGLLFNDELFRQMEGGPQIVRIVGENMNRVTLQNFEGVEIARGRVRWEKTSDRGAPTRMLTFRARGLDPLYFSSEQYLTGPENK